MATKFFFNGVTVDISSIDGRRHHYSADVFVGEVKIGGGVCFVSQKSAHELARQVIEQYFVHDVMPGAERHHTIEDGSTIYIVPFGVPFNGTCWEPFAGVYVAARQIAIRHSWIVESWHITTAAARRAASRMEIARAWGYLPEYSTSRQSVELLFTKKE
jgi:hypothetical protein